MESTIETIIELRGRLLERFRGVQEELAGLPPEAYGRRTVHLILDLHLPAVENMLLGMKASVERLREGAAEAGDAGDMRIIAQVACAAQETARLNAESSMGILDDASAEIRAAQKE